MKNLARHIELLLRDNDCVILPGFGGFIAHTVPAYYASEEHLYYPPTRNISFNASITMNDGLLAQSYMKSYQVDYARATYMIDVAIEELRDTLDCHAVIHMDPVCVGDEETMRLYLSRAEKNLKDTWYAPVIEQAKTDPSILEIK